MQNKNKKRKKNERHTRYGRTARWLSVAMALVFSLTSVGAALPEAAESGASSVAESTVSGIGASSDATSTENAANPAQSAASSADTSDSTPHVTPNPTLTASEKAYESSVNVTEENKGTLTVTAKADAGVLPSDAVLTVKPITKENEDTSETYKQVEKKVKKDVADDNRELTGFLAYDISFIQNNEEIEPSGKVNVTMKWTDAAKPEGTTEAEQKDSDVSVLHLAKNKDGSKEIKDTEVVNLTENKEKGENKDNQATVEVKKDSKAVEKAEMTVDGFSVFTITWTTSTPNATARFAQVKLHYVDENGNELADPTNEPTSTMLAQGVNNIITLKNYAEDATNSNATRMANYTYVEARLANAKTGTVVTGFLGKETADEKDSSKKTYSLKYTSTDPVPSTTTDSNWTNIPSDAVTGANNNSVDVYLVYTENPHVTIHYVNENREEIAESSVKYAEDLTKETLVLGWSEASLSYNGTLYTREGVHIGRASGDSVYSVQSVLGISGKDYTLQYRTSADSNWVNLPLTDRNADIYVVYEEEPSLTIHYVNETGTDVASATTKYANEFASDAGVEISSDTTNWVKSIDNYAYKDAHLASYTGTAVTHARAVKSGDKYTIQAKSGDGSSWEDVSTSNLYLVYNKANYTAKLNVHYMDIGGEPIKDASGNPIIRYLDASDFTTATDVSGSDQFAITINGYTFSNRSLNQTEDSQSPTGMTLIGSNNAPKNGDTVNRGKTKAGLFRDLSYNNVALTLTGNSAGTAKKNADDSYDIYLMYIPHLTVHYVDSDGNELYSDYTTDKSIQWGNTVTNNSATLNDYYNGHGTPDHIYDALPTDVSKNEITALKWGHSTSGDNNNWLTTLTLKGSGTSTRNALVKDVYMVYDKSITVHHVDENGNKLADDTKVGVTSGNAMTPSSFGKSLSGYTVAGAYFANPKTDTNAKSFSSVTYTKNEDNWTSSATMSDGDTDTTDHNEVWVVYKQASMLDVKDGIRIHYVDKDGSTVASDKVISTSSWDVNTSQSTWGWNGAAFITNGTVTNDYLPTNPALGQPSEVYLGSVADGRKFTLGSGNRAINFKYDTTNGWQTGIDSSSASTAPASEKTYKGLIMDLTFVYPSATPSIIVHHVDSGGNKLADDTEVNVTSSKTTFSLSDFQKTDITNHTASSVKYGSTFSDAKSFENVAFTKSGKTWQYALNSGIAQDVEDKAEVYVVYTANDDNRRVVVHFVDEDGTQIAPTYSWTNSNAWIITKKDYTNAWHGGDISTLNDFKNAAKAVPSGYTFVGEYFGPTFTNINDSEEEVRRIQTSERENRNLLWSYRTDQGEGKDGWYTTWGTGDNPHVNFGAAGMFNEFITDIYWVYKKPTTSNDLTLHYMHVQLDDKGNIVRDDNGNPQYQLYESSQLGDNHRSKITYEEVETATKESGGLDLTDAKPATYAQPITIKRNNKDEKDSYYGSYLGSPKSDTDQLPDYALISSDGPHISKVRVLNGQYQFLSTNGVANEEPFTQTQRNVWTYTTTAGRTFTLRKDDNSRLSIVDSDGGLNAFDLSMTSSDGTTNTYTSVSGAEGTGVVFTVKESGSTYKLTVQEWMQIPQHDIYQLYVNETSPLINVGDEIIYSGNLVARTTHLPAGAEIISYKWEKQVNGLAWEEVTRSRNGNDWNIANDLKDRSWLNLVADNGELSEDEGRNSVSYRVTLTYKENNETKTVTSVPYDVSYWDQLENGSFETPINDNKNKATDNYTEGGNFYDGTFYSNEYYKKLGGVWQTTGVGHTGDLKTTPRNGKDIEIINVNSSNNYQNNYSFYNGTRQTDGKAAAGDQFAELNAEAPGALYQDVVTHPNEYLNYWLSHRARGASSSTVNYDTMYLVIMPTRLAMTGAQDGGELKSQEDLENFIANHGGYEPSGKGNNHTTEENTVIYRNTNSGILVERITSDNKNWHSIDVSNGYVATSTLTRFFFVAGPTSYTSDNVLRNVTLGNLLDNVGFSQRLQTPTTPHYHMVVEKTFTGLSVSDVAKLASNRADSGKAFQLKIDEYLKGEDRKYSLRKSPADGSFDDSYYELDDGGKHVQSLNGATLGFRVDNSNNFILTATGVDPTNKNKTVDLFSQGNGTTDAVYIDPVSGTVRMRWTLANNYFPNGKDDPKEKYFQVTESNADLNGYADNTTTYASVVHGGENASQNSDSYASKASNVSDIITVKNQDSALVYYTNAYRDNRQDEPEQIKVQKTFSGVTPSVVDQLTGSSTPFSITVSKDTSGSNSIKLIGNETRPVDGTYPTGVDRVALETHENNDGSSTYTWTIYGTKDGTWISGNTYYVKEENYTPDSNNPVTGITLNGQSASKKDDNNVIWDGGTSGFKSVSVGTEGNIPTINTTGNIVSKPTTGVFSGTLDTSTNLIIAKYTSGVNNAVHYLVWTPGTLGVNEKAAVRKVIADKFNNKMAVDEKSVGWRSGNNPGQMEIDTLEATGVTKGNMTYDSTTGSLTFTDSAGSGAKWQSYYNMFYDKANATDREKYTEIRIKNNYEPAVRIMKESSDNTPKLLEGAEFKLYKYGGNGSESGTKQYLVMNNSKLDWGDATKAITFKTGSDGIAVSGASGNTSMAIINGLENGIYYLEETKAPDGYNMPTKNVVAIKVDANGIVTQVTDTKDLPEAERSKINTSTTGKDGVTIDWNSPYYTVTIKNSSGFALPETGGRGTVIFTILGLLLLFGSGTWLYLRRKRSSIRLR